MKQVVYGIMDTPVDPDADGILLTEPYLLLKNDKYLHNKKNIEILEASFQDEMSLLDGHKYTISKMEELVKIIREWSNRKYDLNLSFEQYKLIYHEFLAGVIYSVNMVYRKLSVYKDIKECFFFGGNHKVNGKLRFRFTEDYYEFLYEFLLERLGAQNRGKRPSTSYAEGTTPEWKVVLSKIRHLRGTIRTFCDLHRVHRANSLLIRTFLPDESVRRITKRSDRQVLTMNMSVFEWLDRKYDKDMTIDFNMKFRQEMFEGFECRNRFERLLKDVIIEIIPPVLCEKFLPSYRRVEKIAGNYKVKKLYTAACLWVPYGYMFAAALKKDGTRICDIQHSASYGYLKPFSWLELNVFDEFITWGWSEPNPYKNMKPLACTRFVDHEKCNAKNENMRILLVTNDCSNRETITGDYPGDCINKHLSFVRALSKDFRKYLVIRLRDDVFCFAEIYKKEFPEVTLEYPHDLTATESIDRSTIVVTDHNSSMFMETLMMEKPVFFYDGLRPLSVNKCMLEWLEKLEMGGLYYQDGAVLAEAVNSGIDGLISKYHEESNRLLVKEFVKEFLGNWEDAENIWLKEFME